MYATEQLDAIFVVTPTKVHHLMAKPAIEKGIHVFCEKPFSLTIDEGEELVALAEKHSVNNQVGFHNNFIGTFRELKRLLKAEVFGDLFHFTGEAYGPVVTKSKGGTWRSKTSEGGGCLNDYSSHVVNLIQECIGRPVKVKKQLGWEPKYDLQGLVDDMMQGDLKLMQKDKYLRDGGYQTMNYFE